MIKVVLFLVTNVERSVIVSNVLRDGKKNYSNTFDELRFAKTVCNLQTVR